MATIKAKFEEKHYPPFDFIKTLHWSGNHWDDILYFPKDYQIGHIKQGQGTFFQGDAILPITADQFYRVHPGNLHSGKPDFETGWAADVVVVKTDYVAEICRFEPDLPAYTPMVTTNAEENAELNRNFRKVLDVLQDAEQDLILKESNLYYAIYNLITLSTQQHPAKSESITTHAAIKRAQTFIEENFKTNFSLDELAKQVYLSKFHLLRIFKQHLGISPGLYQIQLRLNEARKLIFKDLSLTEVALELGFSDQAHFTNTFKRYSNGASPRDLRKTAIFYNFTE